MRNLALLLLCGGCCFKAVNVGGIGASTGTVSGTGTGGSTSGFAAGTSSGGTSSGTACSPFGAACPTGQYCNYAVANCGGRIYAAGPGTCIAPQPTGGPCRTDADCDVQSQCSEGICFEAIGGDCGPPKGGLPGPCPEGTLTSVPPHTNDPCESASSNLWCIASVCPTTPDPWPQRGHDAQHTSRSTADTSDNSGAVIFRSIFDIDAGFGIPDVASGPAIAALSDGGFLVLQMSSDGGLMAFAGNGADVWSTGSFALRPLQQLPSVSTPAIDPFGVVLVVGGACFNGAPSGFCDQGLFQFGLDGVFHGDPFFGSFASSPAVLSDGRVLMSGPGESSLGATQIDEFSFQGDSGLDPLRSFSFSLSSSPEKFSYQIVGAVSSDGRSYWVTNLTGPNVVFGLASEAADAGAVGSLLSLWPDGGLQVLASASSSLPGFGVSVDEVTTGLVYVDAAWKSAYGGVANVDAIWNELQALSPTTGEVAWTFEANETAISLDWVNRASDLGNNGPAIGTDGTVYLGAGDGLYALEGATGVQEWLFPSANVSAAPAIGGDGTIFFGCSDGMFYAVYPDGGLRFAIDAGATVAGSPAIAPDGTVVFVSDDGTLWGVR